MPNELSQVKPEGSRAPIPLENTHPAGGGTMISIQKTDVFAGGGQKAVSEKQAKILCAPLDPKEVKILPDTGSIYVSWEWYAHRLTKAFGPMGWTMLPVTDKENQPIPPVCKDEVMYREFVLRADDRFVASALGECGYKSSNKRMTWGDAVEGARSNALSRCCKGLGMAHELHDESWREAWIKDFAICVVVSGSYKTQKLWRRKSGVPFRGEQGHATDLCVCEKCASGEPSVAKDGKRIINAPVETPPAEWSGVIEKVNVVVKQKANDPERFNITGNNQKFYTLDKDVATRAKAAMDSGDHVRIHHKPGKWGLEITALLLIEQPSDPQPESGGQEE